MSTDDPMADLEIQRQDLKWDVCVMVFTLICSLGDFEQNIYIFSAVSQTDYRS